ncbi:MAG: NAD(P)H-dependent oxidoreductase [Nocardiaceae bacterium]|nr:NAD(P)H-dependent oxidoreductase [Nocardiaceae bacterium]
MSNRRPRALWVLAHPDDGSFNRQLFHAGRTKLEETHELEVTDLYAMRFDPVLSHTDLGAHAAGPGTFLQRWGDAYSSGNLPEDVRREQHKLLAADLIVLQFPLWWYSLPAILKGWFDRVFSEGFGFDVPDETTGHKLKYGAGRLVGKRALISVSAGVDAPSIAPRGIAGDIDSLLFPLTHGTLWYTGISPLPLHVITGADDLDADQVQAETARFLRRIDSLAHEQPTAYRSSASGDYRPGHRLRDEFHTGRTDLGIHLTTVR